MTDMDSQEQQSQPETPQLDAAMTSPTPAAEPTPAPEPSPTPTPTPKPAPAPAQSGGFLRVLTDLCLVAMTAAVIGGGAWYLKGEMERYHIPSPLELAMQENEKLSLKLQELEEAAFKADEQSRLRERYAQLQKQLQLVKQATQDKEAKINEANQKILALQHEIRSADRDARSLARNQLLPGMMVGIIRTKKGQVYNGAIIRAIDGKLITVRHDSGQARFNMNLLVTESLPPIVRYAFGLVELVDTSDFQSADGASEPQKSTKKKPASPKPASTTRVKPKSDVTTHSFASYDPAIGVPVVDGNTPTPSAGSGTGAGSGYQAPAPVNTSGWAAPDDPLPL